MLICNNCGKTISELDLDNHNEYLSDFGGEPIYENVKDKCFCGGQYVEAIICDLCNEYFLDKDIIYGWRYNVKICKNCFDCYRKKYDNEFNQLIELEDFVDWLVDNGNIKKK